MASRIQLDDTQYSIMEKMSDGHPEAYKVLMSMILQGEQIDPDNFFGGLGSVLLLDTFGIYGRDIYKLYRDVCLEDTTMVIGLLRAVQVGILPKEQLINKIVVDKYVGLDYARTYDILDQLKERLPNFGKVR